MGPTDKAARLLRGARRFAAVSALCLLGSYASRASAHDVSDELTLGRIASSSGTATPYWSDRIDGSFDLSDELMLGLDVGATHYASTPSASASEIFQVGVAASWLASEHFTFDADAYLSPTSTSAERGVALGPMRKGAVRAKTSSLGFGLGGEYDTAGDSDAESALGLALGATSYTTTQRARLGKGRLRVLGPAQTTSLLQWRATASFTETLWQDSDVGVSASYYLYSRDATQTGLYGAAVLGRFALGDGIPLEPLQYSVRPNLAHRFGPLRVSASGQLGHYLGGEGWSWIGGLKLRYRFSETWSAWLGGNLQRDLYASGDALSIVWANAGARLSF
jgi:hypothetical protein